MEDSYAADMTKYVINNCKVSHCCYIQMAENKLLEVV